MIERIEAAETKDDLLAIGDEMGVNVNKRQGIETIRAELTEAAEGSAEAPEQETQTAEPEPEPEAKPKQRMLKHLKNGRTFPWTAALAKNRYMQEV